MSISITLHKSTQVLILQNKLNKYLIFHTPHYYIKYPLHELVEIYFNKNCKAIELRSRTALNNWGFWKPIIDYNNYSLSHYFVKKIKFSGKSYKIKKATKYFLFEFNKAHFELVIWKNLFLKKIKKNKILIFSANNFQAKKACQNIINIRSINPFTKRGLVGGRYTLMKKIGKKSS